MDINRMSTRAHKGNHHYGRYRQIALILVKYRLGGFIRILGLDHYLPFSWTPPGNPVAQANIFRLPAYTDGP